MGRTAENPTKNPIDFCAFSELVYETMTLILDIFEDSKKLQN
jgi:hypothetical protein